MILFSLRSFVVYHIGIVNTSIHEFHLVPSCCYIERPQMSTCSPEQRNMISKLCYYYSESSAPGMPLNTVYVHPSSTLATACAGCGFKRLHSKQSLVLKPAPGMLSAVIMELQPCSTVAVKTQTKYAVSSLAKSSKNTIDKCSGLMSGADGIAFYA